MFAAGWTDARDSGSHGRASSAKVPTSLIDVVETRLNPCLLNALQHDVTALAVQGDDA